MAEEAQGQDKSEEATPRKREKAREEGQAARSRELNTMTVLVAGSVAVVVFGGGMRDALSKIMTGVAEMAVHPDGQLLPALHFATVLAVKATLPLLVLVFVVALVSSGAMGGFVFSTKVLAFKGEPDESADRPAADVFDEGADRAGQSHREVSRSWPALRLRCCRSGRTTCCDSDSSRCRKR